MTTSYAEMYFGPINSYNFQNQYSNLLDSNYEIEICLF